MILCEQDYPKILDEIFEFVLAEFGSNLSQGDVELVFMDGADMRELNKTQRSKDYATDVLSFAYEKEAFGVMLGSIVICNDFVKTKAKELGHSCEHETALLFTHGLLHVLGYDHESDNGEMREAERAVIAHFKLPDSLIVRSGC